MAAPALRRRGRRLLLPHPGDERALGAGPRRRPHRAHQGGPPVRRPGRRPHRGGLVDAHLPRGRAQPRRLGAALPRRRRLPGAALRRAGRTGAHRRHRPHPAQGPEAPPAGDDPGHLRGTARARGGHRQPAVRRPDRAGGRPARRRGDDRLVVGRQHLRGDGAAAVRPRRPAWRRAYPRDRPAPPPGSAAAGRRWPGGGCSDRENGPSTTRFPPSTTDTVATVRQASTVNVRHLPASGTGQQPVPSCSSMAW